MSTKASLNHCVDEASGTEAHLYEECLASDGSVGGGDTQRYAGNRGHSARLG